MTQEIIVSVIEILRGHSNASSFGARGHPRSLSDRNPTWPLKPSSGQNVSSTYRSQWSKSYVATQTWQGVSWRKSKKSQWSKSYVATQTGVGNVNHDSTNVSVIEILRGHSNCNFSTNTILPAVSVIEILRGHSNADVLDSWEPFSVSVIEILRGHSNPWRPRSIITCNCLSDRNPTWPLKLFIINT